MSLDVQFKSISIFFDSDWSEVENQVQDHLEFWEARIISAEFKDGAWRVIIGDIKKI